MVIIEHVDWSEFISTGHLIYKYGEINKSTIRKFEKDTAGKGHFQIRQGLG